MASQRKLELLISIVTKNRKEIDALLKQLTALNSASSAFKGPELDKFAQELGRAKNELSSIENQLKTSGSGAGKTALNVTAIATSFSAVTQAVTLASQAASRFYSDTIGANERLNQQILGSAASLAATQDIFNDGLRIDNAAEAIEQLRGPLAESLKDLEVQTRDLVGVTSGEVNSVYSILLQNVGQITNQSKETNDVLESSVGLTKSFVAATGQLGIPLDQIRQEINSILTAQISSDSQLAKSLGITNAQVRDWRAQNVLVDELNGRLSAFVSGNAAAAQSISGVSSNIRDIFEVVARNASEPLLAPIVGGLNNVFSFLDQNQSDIETFFSDIAQEVISVAEKISGNLEPTLDALLELLGTALPLAKDLFSLALTGIEAVSRAAGPLIEYLAGELNELFEVAQKVIDAIQFRQANDAAAALDVLAQSTRTLTTEAQGYIAKIEALNQKQQEQGQLSEKDAARLKQYQSLLTAVQGELDNQIEAVKGVSGAQGDAAEQQQALISGLKDLRNATSESTQGVDIQAKELRNLGTAYDQLAEKAAAARDAVASGVGDPARIEQAAQELAKLTSQQFDLGQIDEAEALSSLNTIIGNQKLSADVQIAAAAEVRKIQKTTSDEKLASIEAELKATQSAADAEGRITAESAIKINNLRQQQLQERLRANQEAIATESRLLEQDAGSQRNLNQLKDQQKTLQAELGALAVQGQRDIEKARLEEIDRAQLDIQELAARTRATIFQEEQALLQERSRNAELTEQQIQARIGQLRTESDKERIQQEIALQEQRVQVFEEGSRKRRQAEIELGELRLQLDQSVAAAQEADRAVTIAAIDAQIEDEQRLQELQQSRLQLRQQAEERVLSSLQEQRDLFESQLSLINERNGLAQSLAGAETADAQRALQIRQELSNNENLSKAQRKQLEQELTNLGFSRNTSEKKIAEQILERKKQEIQLEAQALQAQQAAERAQLQFQNQLRTLEAERESRIEQGRLRELECQRDLLELEAQKADARGDARGAEIARDSVDRTNEAIGQQQQAIAQAQRSERTVEQVNANALQQLSAKQARESFEFARNVAQESQQLATDLSSVNKRVGQQAQRFANQQDDIADGAKLDAQETLNSLRDVSLNTAIQDLAVAQRRTNASIDILTSTADTAEVLEGQLSIEQDLLTTTQERLQATKDLNDALGNPANQAQTQPIPSFDTGGPLPAGQTAMIHAGELLVPGAPTRSAAVNAIATGRTIQSVRSDGLYRGPGGYVLNRGDVQQLTTSPVGALLRNAQPSL